MKSNITITAGGHVVPHDQQTRVEEAACELRAVFYSGAVARTETLAAIRARLLGGG